MRDVAFVIFIAALLLLALKRPFVFVLAYAYVDIVAPQRLSYYLLNSIPISMLLAGLAVGSWLLTDARRRVEVSPRQGLMLLLLAYAGWTTINADFPLYAPGKWEWVWKSMFWAIFLPFTLRTKLRIEAYLLVMLLSAAALVIVGGLKTVLSGGGYGVLNLMVDNNTGLYEGSTISCVAIAIIPLILWFARFGTIFPPDRRVWLFAGALIFACLLMPIGTEARTGLLCIAMLGVLLLRFAKSRVVWLGLAGVAGIAAVPFLPASFTERMSTIQTYRADSSATTRLAVWAWTWNYAKSHPLGGGFEAYLQNKVRVATVSVGGAIAPEEQAIDKSRAYHSAYFEMLGEQGFPGLFLWLLIHGTGLLRMEVIRRRHANDTGERAWIAPLAVALQHGQIIYLVGAAFVGIAWQPFIMMLLGVQIAFDRLVSRRPAGRGFVRPRRPAPAATSQPSPVRPPAQPV